MSLNNTDFLYCTKIVHTHINVRLKISFLIYIDQGHHSHLHIWCLHIFNIDFDVSWNLPMHLNKVINQLAFFKNRLQTDCIHRFTPVWEIKIEDKVLLPKTTYLIKNDPFKQQGDENNLFISLKLETEKKTFGQESY